MTLRPSRVLTGWELGLFFAGIAITGILVAETLVVFAADAELARGIVRGVVAEVFTGREGGIPVALSEGVPPVVVFQYSVMQDLAAAFLVYPFFVHALHRYHDHDSFLMRRLRRIEAAAERRRHYVDRWGPVGVFLFMLVPFLVNGPLVGFVLGRVAGIRTRHLIVPVVAATAVAAAAWTFLIDVMLGLANVVEPGLGRWIAVGVAGVLGILVLMDAWRDRRAARADEEE